MTIIKGTFGKEEEPEKPTATECMETFLAEVTLPAEAGDHESVDVVCLQLDDFGVSVGSNYEDPAHIIVLLEMAKLSILERFMGMEVGAGLGGGDGTIH